jgi:hypothetical protein
LSPSVWDQPQGNISHELPFGCQWALLLPSGVHAGVTAWFVPGVFAFILLFLVSQQVSGQKYP